MQLGDCTAPEEYAPACSSQALPDYALCIGPGEAAIYSIGVTFAYVAVMYLPCNRGERNSPRVICNRLLFSCALACISEAYVLLRTSAFHARPAGIAPVIGSVLQAVALTALLYAGHLILLAIDGAYRRAVLGQLIWTARERPWIFVRNSLAAPLLEEVVFRRQALIVWQCLPTAWRILGPSALFSVAHLHHAFGHGLSSCLLQLSYTFFFGVYAAALYLGLGNLVAPAIAAHAICNTLGLPNFSGISLCKWPRSVSAIYFVCVVLCLGTLSSRVIDAVR